MAVAYVVRLASRNLMRHKWRSLLTLVGIAVAVVAFGVLRTIVDSWYQGASLGEASRLVTRSSASLAFSLPLSHAQKIKRVPGVEQVTWANWFGGVYQDPKNFFPQFAVDASTYMAVYHEFKLEPAQIAAFQADRRGALVGQKLANKFGWKVGDQIPLKGTLYPGTWSFTVRGIFQGADSKVDTGLMLMHWSYVNDSVKTLLPSAADQVGVFVLNLSKDAAVGPTAVAVDAQFKNSLAETRTESQRAFQLGFIAMVDTILLAIQSVAYVVLFIIMAVMANTMAMAARERTREYAALRALGFQSTFISGLIVAESMTLALTGGVLGIVLTFPVSQGFYSLTRDLFALFEVSTLTVFIQTMAAIVIGLVAAFVPVINAKKIQIVDGLRAIQ